MQHALHIHDRRRWYIAMAAYIAACGCMDMTLYFVNCTKPERCTTHIVWIMPVQRHSYCMTILHSMTISFFVCDHYSSLNCTNQYFQPSDRFTYSPLILGRSTSGAPQWSSPRLQCLHRRTRNRERILSFVSQLHVNRDIPSSSIQL